MNQFSEEKKLKSKSSLMRSDARSDYKVEKSTIMDIFAVLGSVALAVLFWGLL